MARRALNPMPADIRQRLLHEQVMGDYDERPAYQRNDYLGWIARATREETRQRRIDQMVDELRVGGVYMKMDHPPSAKD